LIKIESKYIYNFTKDFVSITIFDIDNISEASCDTEGWSNDAGSSTWHQRNSLQFTIDSKRKL